MNTRPSTIAAEDLTGPPVLKLQSNDNLSGKAPEATPVRAGLPRNIGQFVPTAWRPSDALPAHAVTKIVVTAARNAWVALNDFISDPSRVFRASARPPGGGRGFN